MLLFRLPIMPFWHRRPSKIDKMDIIKTTLWCPKGFDALTFFGHILSRDNDERHGGMETLLNHEHIHLRQAQSLHDSWWLFYAVYLWYWLKALPSLHWNPMLAYRLNPFEMEAYLHQHDRHYAETCRHGAWEWRRYASLPAKKRMNH